MDEPDDEERVEGRARGPRLRRPTVGGAGLALLLLGLIAFALPLDGRPEAVRGLIAPIRGAGHPFPPGDALLAAGLVLVVLSSAASAWRVARGTRLAATLEARLGGTEDGRPGIREVLSERRDRG